MRLYKCAKRLLFAVVFITSLIFCNCRSLSFDLHGIRQKLLANSSSTVNSSLVLHANGSSNELLPTVISDMQLSLRPVWWFAPFLDFSSFGVEAITLVLGLLSSSAVQRDSLWISLLQDSCRDMAAAHMHQDVHAELMRLRYRGQNDAERAVVVCHNLPPFFSSAHHMWSPCEPCPPPQYAYAVCRAMAETDGYHQQFAGECNKLNEVWVPTEFSKDVLIKAGIKGSKIHIVPLSVNTSWYSPDTHSPAVLPMGELVFGHPVAPYQPVSGVLQRPAQELPEGAVATRKPFTFLSVFKWERRKGWDALLEAYLSEFSANDNVVLYVLTKPFMGSANFKDRMHDWLGERLAAANRSESSGFSSWLNRWKTRKLHSEQLDPFPSLYVIPTHIPNEEYARLLAAADAFVLATRGEGWGLPLTEAMAMGKPVIATNWSGVPAYLDDTVGYPVQYELKAVPTSEPYWFHGFKWAEPSVKHLRQVMRHVVDHPEEAADKGRSAAARIQERYTPELVAQVTQQHLRRINRGLDDPATINQVSFAA